MAIIASDRMTATSSGVISGSGLAIANIIGFSDIDLMIVSENAPLTESPIKTSAPSAASSSVRLSVTAAWADFHWFIPASRPL